jgi:agmatinase
MWYRKSGFLSLFDTIHILSKGLLMAIASVVNVEPQNAEVLLISANYDRTSSLGKGADRGPAAILQMLNTQVELFDLGARFDPSAHLKIGHVELGDLNHCSPEEMVGAVANVYRRYPGAFPVLLGGEHSVTNAPLRALAGKLDPREVTVVQIDAHGDLRMSDADFRDEPFGRFSHACVMRRAHELGYRILQHGIRVASEEEEAYRHEHRETIRTFYAHQGMDTRTVIEAIKTEQVYLTIDVDGFDPAHMPSTGTPVQGGLGWWDTLNFIRRVLTEFTVIGMDVVETAVVTMTDENPETWSSQDVLTAQGAAQLVYSSIAYRYARDYRLKKEPHDARSRP